MTTSRSGQRKEPRQERSKATVERIVDAGGRVLIAYGYEGASTNRIASAAQLSPGSLYQYFSDKDAIVKAVMDRLSLDISTKISASFRSMAGCSAEDGTRAVLGALVAALNSQAELVRVAVEQIPSRFGDTDVLTGTLARARDLVFHQLLANQSRLRHRDQDTTIWFVMQMTTQLSIRYVVDRPQIPAEQFVDELTRLLINYVYGD
ncbi:MAG: TetR/AcrR family transcriptional regulator [Mycobacterium sp.]|nr:TetR/AcrR family transcriptional regulator [Mycobacterium sp.]